MKRSVSLNAKIIPLVIMLAAVVFSLCMISGISADAEDYIKGDINGDGVINSSDAMSAVAYAKKTAYPKSDSQLYMADVNGSGIADTVDAMLIISVAKKQNIPNDMGWTAESKPGKVVLKTQAVTPGYITLKWGAAANADRYEIQYKRTSDKAYGKAVYTKDLSYVIKNIYKNDRYDIRIRALKGSSAGEYTKFSIDTWTVSGAITTDYTSVNISVVIRWNAVNNAVINGKTYKASGYQTALKSGGAYSNVRSYSAAGRSYTTRNNAPHKYLTCGVRYFVRVNCGGVIVNYFSSYKDVSVLSPPTSTTLTASSSASGTVTLKWQKPTSGCDGYYIYMKESSVWRLAANVANGSSTSYTVKGLKGGDYSFQAVPYGKNKYDGYLSFAPWSAPASITIGYTLKGYDGLILIGDSRLYQLSQVKNITKLYDNTIFIAKPAAGYSWLVSDAVPQLEKYLKSGKKYVVVFTQGINDMTAAGSYTAKYNELRKKYGGTHRLYGMSVNPCVDGARLDIKLGGTGIYNSKIDAFNEKMKAFWGNRYIDMSSYLKENGFDTKDGIHYIDRTNVLIFNTMLENISEDISSG